MYSQSNRLPISFAKEAFTQHLQLMILNGSVMIVKQCSKEFPTVQECDARDDQ
jgi:hypothetical protein